MNLGKAIAGLRNNVEPIAAADLIAAVKQNDVKKLKGYLDRAADPNLQNKFGETALHWAASQGHPDLAALLLDRAADPNLQNEIGDTALHWAVFWNHPDLATLLLDRAADPNLQDKNGSTALHFAASEGFLDCVVLLLDRAADPNLKNKFGNTALDIALREYNKTHDDKYKKIADMLERAMEERRLEDKMESNIKRLIRGKRDIPPILDKWLVVPKGKGREKK